MCHRKYGEIKKFLKDKQVQNDVKAKMNANTTLHKDIFSHFLIRYKHFRNKRITEIKKFQLKNSVYINS